MIFIKHRVNSIKSLNSIDQKLGVEFDVRSYKNYLTLSHDSFKKREKLSKYVNFLKHKLAVVDIKEEGIELATIKQISKSKIKNYFLINVSLPKITFFLKKNKKVNLCLRLSDF